MLTNYNLIIPKEIITLILRSIIEGNFNSVLTLRLANKLISQITDEIAQELSAQFFGTIKYNERPVACSFFKLTNEEVRRLKLGIDFLKNNKNVTRGYLNGVLPEEVNRTSLLFSLKNDLKTTIQTQLDKDAVKIMTASFTFSNLVVKKRSVMPKEFGLLLNVAINARSYESIAFILEKIKTMENVCFDSVIDDIYQQAAQCYNVREFMRLSNVISIDLNREIGYWITGSGYFTRSLFHHAAGHGNISLVEYLIAQDVNASTSLETLKLILKEIERTIRSYSYIPDQILEDNCKENLRLTSDCLMQLACKIENSTTLEPASKKQCRR